MDNRSAPHPASQHLPLLYLLLMLLMLCAWNEPCLADKTYPDAFFRDRDNDNTTLIVFIAGLAGDATWKTMNDLMEADSRFSAFDYLRYDSPQTLTIEENIRRAMTLVSEHRSAYKEVVYVGHSIGGIMIKSALLSELSAHPDAPQLPKMVITFGTPLNLDKFSVSLFKRLGARIFWTSVSPLQREVFNIDRLKEINAAWRTAVVNAPLKDVRTVYIFGAQDQTAPVKGESESSQVVFVKGDHRGIVTPESAQACAWIVFSTALLDPEKDLQSLGCVQQTALLSASPPR